MANRIVSVHAGICGIGIYAIMLPSSGFSVTHWPLKYLFHDLKYWGWGNQQFPWPSAHQGDAFMMVHIERQWHPSPIGEPCIKKTTHRRTHSLRTYVWRLRPWLINGYSFNVHAWLPLCMPIWIGIVKHPDAPGWEIAGCSWMGDRHLGIMGLYSV